MKSARVATTIALLGVATFTGLLLALHVLDTGIDPIVYTTSQYASAPYGLLMSISFVSLSVGTFALLFALSRPGLEPAETRLARTLLGYWGVALLVAMLFPLHEVGGEPTLASTVHRVNGPLGFLAMTGSAVLLSRAFGRDEKWRPIARAAQILAALMVALFLVTGPAAGMRLSFAGASQRALLVVLVAWFALSSARALVLARR